MSATTAIGIDLGGTNLRVARVENIGGEETPVLAAEHREKVADARDPESIVERLGTAVEALSDGDNTLPVGVGIAAMLRGHEGMVANSPHLRWRDTPFGDMMRARLPGRPISVINDVNAVTYGEYACGAGRGVDNIVAVFFGTGIGGGAVIHGTLLEGANNCAAEIGHTKVVLSPTARLCACGLRGCVEAYAGGNALLQRVAEDVAAGVSTSAAHHAGDEPINPGHIDRAAHEGDGYAVALWNEIAPLCGLVLANVVTFLNPDRLIIGGGVMSRTPALQKLVIQHMRKLANPPALEGLLVAAAALGDDAGLIGSALLGHRGQAAPGTASGTSV